VWNPNDARRCIRQIARSAQNQIREYWLNEDSWAETSKAVLGVPFYVYGFAWVISPRWESPITRFLAKHSGRPARVRIKSGGTTIGTTERDDDSSVAKTAEFLLSTKGSVGLGIMIWFTQPRSMERKTKKIPLGFRVIVSETMYSSRSQVISPNRAYQMKK